MSKQNMASSFLDRTLTGLFRSPAAGPTTWNVSFSSFLLFCVILSVLALVFVACCVCVQNFAGITLILSYLTLDNDKVPIRHRGP
jgi:hypothetical protein